MYLIVCFFSHRWIGFTSTFIYYILPRGRQTHKKNLKREKTELSEGIQGIVSDCWDMSTRYLISFNAIFMFFCLHSMNTSIRTLYPGFIETTRRSEDCYAKATFPRAHKVLFVLSEF